MLATRTEPRTGFPCCTCIGDMCIHPRWLHIDASLYDFCTCTAYASSSKSSTTSGHAYRKCLHLFRIHGYAPHTHTVPILLHFRMFLVRADAVVLWLKVNGELCLGADPGCSSHYGTFCVTPRWTERVRVRCARTKAYEGGGDSGGTDCDRGRRLHDRPSRLPLHVAIEP